MKKRKMPLAEWLSIKVAKNPSQVVLAIILLFNVIFFLVAALIIDNLALPGTETLGFWESLYYSVMMVLDAGNADTVVDMATGSKKVLAVVCIVIVIIGMVIFTGAVIGYITNYISDFVDNSRTGNHALNISGHLVILNWNNRASEIINDLLFCPTPQKVVVLPDGQVEEIKKEISERIQDTIHRENTRLHRKCQKMGWLEGNMYYRRNRIYDNLTVIVRQGDVFSSKQLNDIALKHARAVVILVNDTAGRVCKFEQRDLEQEKQKGNPQIIKTLMQVADITSSQESDDDQKIIVEISDPWTEKLVEKIIHYKQVRGKCNIVPIRVHEVLGRILSQFCLMPELNKVYTELFSNQGTTFQVEERTVFDDPAYISEYLPSHPCAIPLSSMDSGGRHYFFYSASDEKYMKVTEPARKCHVTAKLNPDYWIEQKNVIILGHNSNNLSLVKGFESFCNEWDYADDEHHILNIIVIDDEESLKRMNYYKDYPFVMEVVKASIYDKDIIHDAIETFLKKNSEDISILILSDNQVSAEDADAKALANLVYTQEIIASRMEEEPDFDPKSIDIIVEIIDPKHHDVVSSYSVDNVVISNRYISKMITQIGEKEAIFDFYSDILCYDDSDGNFYTSKEVYVKKAGTFFDQIPGECSAYDLIRSVWEASIDPALPPEKRFPTIVLGYIDEEGEVTLFDENMRSAKVALTPKSKIIVFSNH